MKCKKNKEKMMEKMMDKALIKNDLENKNKNQVNQVNKNKINKERKMNNYKRKIQMKIRSHRALKKVTKKDKSCNKK